MSSWHNRQRRRANTREKQVVLKYVFTDGTVIDENVFCILGGDSDAVQQRLQTSVDPNASLQQAIRDAAAALAGPDRPTSTDELEVAILVRGDQRRCFSRLNHQQVSDLLK